MFFFNISRVVVKHARLFVLWSKNTETYLRSTRTCCCFFFYYGWPLILLLVKMEPEVQLKVLLIDFDRSAQYKFGLNLVYILSYPSSVFCFGKYSCVRVSVVMIGFVHIPFIISLISKLILVNQQVTCTSRLMTLDLVHFLSIIWIELEQLQASKDLLVASASNLLPRHGVWTRPSTILDHC